MRDAGRRPLAAVAVAALAGMAVLTGFGTARSQATVELTPMVGWQWGGTLDYSAGGDVHVNAALNYGGALGVMLRPGYWGEVSYTYQKSELIARPPAGADSLAYVAGAEFKVFDLGTHYIQLSGARNFMNTDPGARAYPYVIGGLGMTILSPGKRPVVILPGTLNVDTQYLFSLSGGAGLRVTMNKRSDIRLQARFLLPMNFTEGSFYFGSGGGGVSVSGGTFLPQGEVTLAVQLKVTK